MEENKEFELNLSEETLQQLEEYAAEKGTTPEDVAEYIIYEFLRNQIHVIEKRSQETGVPVNELISMQFGRILTYLRDQKH
ncbi:hypothetical protein JCM39194_04240 [Desulfotomaculum varum]|uniref:Uncharacterized protein n=1 Tax=Desulforamulus hydrothermalis Lam5 = DSM 18033 TaxID=1121428 RepID=K8DXL9_9FIRM|nr:hypothetical protein [Desulforamulus hydrothermalis]CCO07344.1 conserved hypothetical protein [Desulforamulus hydrothermalis Lam5 = DSM 18033]SHG94514.1 hypothetical protein SAMN02745177_00890 [Desulforamulus hydrothermalis Lam5 = DSM 18033]